jgi:nitrite reductase/ring-hydroxylating ferredoxin subunit
LEEFVKIAEITEISSGKMKKIAVDGKDILVANVEGMCYAIGNKCTHFGGDLSKGSLFGKSVKCPLHGSLFDVTTGEVQKGPAKKLSKNMKQKSKKKISWSEGFDEIHMDSLTNA